MKKLTIVLLFFTSVLQGQTGAGYWYGSTEPGTITPEPDTLTLTYWDDFILLHIQNTGITEDANGVSQWQDRSGNGNHSTQSVNTNKPSTDGSGNVVFDGTNDWLVINDPWDAGTVNDSAFTIFMVVETSKVPTGSSGREVFFDYNNQTQNLFIQMKLEDSTTFIGYRPLVFDGNAPTFNDIDTFNTGDVFLLTSAASETTTTEHRTNGVEKVSVSNDGGWASTGGTGNYYVGHGRDGANYPLNGKIYFIGIANRKFTPAEIATTESELNTFFTIY